jgi:hypothetical protein
LFLEDHLPDLSDEDRDWAVNHYCGTRTEPLAPGSDDPTFCAAMFLAGVSLGDLAALFRVRRQTIQQKIARRLSPAERKNMRDSIPALDLEVLTMAKDMFDSALRAAPASFKGWHALAIGRALLAAASAKVSEDRELADAEPRPRRYSNMNNSAKTEASTLVASAAPSAESTLGPAAPPSSDTPAPKPGALGDAQLAALDKMFS